MSPATMFLVGRGECDMNWEENVDGAVRGIGAVVARVAGLGREWKVRDE